jgi:ubiquinone/menaquinone biosynthesis C-methylase UbiE
MRSFARRIALQVPAIGRIVAQRDALAREVAQLRDPHYVSEYREHVRRLMAEHPLDEAMSLAVGGDYDRTGKAAVDVLIACGLQEVRNLIDLGCGSGRLAKHVGIAMPQLDYLGIDIVPELIDYAASQSPSHFRFLVHHGIGFPCEAESADMIAVFSVFTHLFHQETFAYLRDARRVLRPGGKVVLSFLESAKHWPIFEHMVSRIGQRQVLDMFIEPSMLAVWAEHLDMELAFGPPIGQSVAILEKPTNQR